jgi:peptide methionine sulfoxide reductase MsrA
MYLVVTTCFVSYLQVSYRKLLDVFFDRVDPTTLNRQGNDRGTQYRSAIYYHDEDQKEQALSKIEEVNQQLSQVTIGKPCRSQSRQGQQPRTHRWPNDNRSHHHACRT